MTIREWFQPQARDGRIVGITTYHDRLIIACEYCLYEAHIDEIAGRLYLTPINLKQPAGEPL